MIDGAALGGGGDCESGVVCMLFFPGGVGGLGISLLNVWCPIGSDLTGAIEIAGW